MKKSVAHHQELARTEFTEMLRRNAKDLNEFAIVHADRSTMPRPSDFNRL